MKEIESRLSRLESRLGKFDSVDQETSEQIIDTPHFAFACITERARLGRDLTEDDKIEIVERLHETGIWKTPFPELLIKWLGGGEK